MTEIVWNLFKGVAENNIFYGIKAVYTDFHNFVLGIIEWMCNLWLGHSER